MQDSSSVSDYLPATRALEEMTKRMRSSRSSADQSAVDDNHIRSKPSCPYTFEGFYHAESRLNEDTFAFPVIEWCFDDEDDIETTRNHCRTVPMFLAQHDDLAKQCRCDAPCHLKRCRALSADTIARASLGLERKSKSFTNENVEQLNKCLQGLQC
jgi:hypothetical protein